MYNFFDLGCDVGVHEDLCWKKIDWKEVGGKEDLLRMSHLNKMIKEITGILPNTALVQITHQVRVWYFLELQR